MQSQAKLAPNIWFHSLHVPKLGWMRSAYQGCIRATRKKLRDIKPDIVHGQGTELDCALDAALSGFPNVVTIHGNMAELARLFRARFGSFTWLAARLESFALKRTGGVFCNSEYTESLVRPRTTRTWRVPNALRLPFFEAPRISHARGKCRLINVGNVSERKRQIELLDMARGLHERGLDFELQFVGVANPKVPYAATFLEKVKEAGAKGYARYSGAKTVLELIDCFDAGDALVHFPCEESFGLVVAEGIARDLKLYGARLGGMLDICKGVPEAELFEAGDWQGLADALAGWIQRGHPRPSGSAKIMRERYHPSVVAQRHLEIYAEVVGKNL